MPDPVASHSWLIGLGLASFSVGYVIGKLLAVMT